MLTNPIIAVIIAGGNSPGNRGGTFLENSPISGMKSIPTDTLSMVLASIPASNAEEKNRKM